MKKNLPLILLVGGLIVVLIAVFAVMKVFKGSSTEPAETEEEEVIPELPQSQWPVVTLTPVADASIPNSLGHLLKLNVNKINVPGASTVDYLLVYTTSNGGQQGVPGTVQLTGGAIDKNLLLGSESSGKYRFDQGVSTGSITLTFRNGSGKSMGKLTSDFHLQNDETDLTSVDGKFTYTLDKVTKGVWFVTMPTFVQPDANPNMVTWKDGYGVFSSDGKPHTGK
jgi:hypothetical protein